MPWGLSQQVPKQPFTGDSVTVVSEAVDDPTENDPTERSEAASPTTTESGLHGREELGEIDVVAIEADLDGVQAALTRLADGTYWTDEVTGEPLPTDVLAADPLARRA